HLAASRNEVRRLRGEAQRLHAGEGRLLSGSTHLHEGAGELADAATQLPAGLEKLGDGAERLGEGLTELQGGADTLSQRLADGAGQAYPLQRRLGQASEKVTSEAGEIEGKMDKLDQGSPGLFDSGYFLLSALDGAPPGARRAAASAVDIDHGGQAAAILV